jgi:HD domain
MSFSEGSGVSSRPQAVALGEVLVFLGSIADYAGGVRADEGKRVASLAVALGRLAGLDNEHCDALYFAARLRNAGVLGNAAYAKGDQPVSGREIITSSWDIPAQSARFCERLACLPRTACDDIRWQAENWDGTGYPDQLRWTGIPKSAQLLHVANAFVASSDADEPLSAISTESGRTFGPEAARTFVMWFHAFEGAIELVDPPHDVLDATATTARDALDAIAEHVDLHNGMPGRSRRMAERSEAIARALAFSPDEVMQAKIASLLYGVAELCGSDLEAAQLIAQCPFLSHVAPVIEARHVAYGTPSPRASRVLAVSVAYDVQPDGDRIERASGTQFDPQVVHALLEVLKART